MPLNLQAFPFVVISRILKKLENRGEVKLHRGSVEVV